MSLSMYIKDGKPESNNPTNQLRNYCNNTDMMRLAGTKLKRKHKFHGSGKKLFFCGKYDNLVLETLSLR